VIERDSIAAVLAELGEPPYRLRQVYQALTRALVTDFDAVTTLPLSLRQALAQRLRPLSLEAVETHVASDGAARRTLFAAADGAPVEGVLMTYPQRATVCVSTQVGCAVGCVFCASGRSGLRRDLQAVEIVDQALHFARLLREEGRRVTNVVFMGMGEPFQNYEQTVRACRILNDEEGFALAARAISVSTIGVVPGIDRFAAEPEQFNLAVSLHAGTDELRDRLIPLNRVYPLDALLGACERYVRRTRRKVMFEYVLLRGVNDTDAQAQAVARRLRPLRAHLNVIAYNETGGGHARPTGDEVSRFCSRVEAKGVECTVRRSIGAGIEAACGQLALAHAKGDTGRC
jgi:23S rRNA (adenine2503-C2)-methyltransferase